MNHTVEYIPIITTLFSVYFVAEIFRHYLAKRTTYLFWWSLGVLTYGLGTLAGSINVLIGWSEWNLRFWYIVGALMGGFPLAQGSVYLLMNRAFAHITSVLFIILIVAGSIAVMTSPIVIPESFNYKLTGSVFAYKWVRYFSPFINVYSFFFLVGGAIYSAIRYYRKGDRQARFKGNIYIAIGGLLPGIGGIFTRMGHVNVLFVTELFGIILIYYGYHIIRADK